MYVTFAALALTVAGHAPAAKWMDDYGAGYRQAVNAGKPLAVVVGRGVTGWNRLDAKGSLDAGVQQMLSDNYVCVYIDAAQAKNQDLVQKLQTGNDAGLVISDHSGQFVAYRHAGSMSQNDLVGTLKLHSMQDAPKAAPAPAAAAPAPVAGSCGVGQACYAPAGCTSCYQPATCGSSRSCGRSRCFGNRGFRGGRCGGSSCGSSWSRSCGSSWSGSCGGGVCR